MKFRFKYTIYNMYQLISLLILIQLFFVSCRTITPVVIHEKAYTGNQIIEQLRLNEPDIDTYSARRMQIKIKENEEEINLRGSVRIKRDSVILFSINAFAGIEAARVLMTRDSVKIIDRINNQYFSGSYDEPIRYFPFNIRFEMLQNLLFGTALPILEDFKILELHKKTYYFEDDRIAVGNSDENFLFTDYSKDIIKLFFDRDFLTRETLFHSENNETFARFNFNSYYNYEGYSLPEDIDIYFVSHNMPFYANIKFNRININDDIRFPFNVPSRYKSVNK